MPAGPVITGQLREFWGAGVCRSWVIFQVKRAAPAGLHVRDRIRTNPRNGPTRLTLW
jgi:hypothetical protein